MNRLRDPDETLTIAEAAAACGVSTHARRYYEQEGLLDVARHRNGHRRFARADLERVAFIGRLRSTAMPIRDMQRYFALAAQGPSTEDARLEILQRHLDVVADRRVEFKDAVASIERKNAHYGGSRVPADSSSLPSPVDQRNEGRTG